MHKILFNTFQGKNLISSVLYPHPQYVANLFKNNQTYYIDICRQLSQTYTTNLSHQRY
jgi:hypothetical protein